MTSRNKKIAVCGAGYCGLVAVSILKEEGGFDPICFEKTDKPAGTWCYREEGGYGVPSIMPTTIINQSKEFGAFSNFPPNKEYSNHMRHAQVFQYFMDYCEKNDVLRHVRYNSEVVEVKKAPDYEESGRWVVSVKDTLTGSVSSDIYDGVLVSTGHVNIPNWPTYENQEKFKGEIIHTHSLKGVSKYAKKNVVVVGMGCSGLDAAVDTSGVAQQVYLSTRSGAYIMSRIGSHGYPMEYFMLRRYLDIFYRILPISWCSWIIENFVLDQRFNIRLLPVKPKYHFLGHDPCINDHIFAKFQSGSVILKGDIESFSEDGVKFKGESSYTKADAVIMATGYTMEFPFFEKGLITEDKAGKVNLYKCMWPTSLKHSTLALIGFFIPFGAGFPIGEMQCRYAAHILAGKGKLPSKEEMEKDITKLHQKNVKRFKPNSKQSLRIDYIEYLDEVGKLFGAKPNLLKMLFMDPKLFLKVMFGPSVPYQYRLQGPHPWDGARKAIMTTEERVHFPLTGTDIPKVENPLIVFIKKFILWLLPFA